MESLAAIQLLIEDDFIQHCSTHRTRMKSILRFRSCDTVCTRCTYTDKPKIRVFRAENRNGVWLDEITHFVDCSHIKSEDVEGRRLIFLKKNSSGPHFCEVNNHCSLGCKAIQVTNELHSISSLDKLKTSRKRRTPRSRRKAEMTIFHRFVISMLVERKKRSGGRLRRYYAFPLPVKKRNLISGALC